MNAAMFTAVLQASRLQSNVHVFAFLLLAIELFALLPILQRQIKVGFYFCDVDCLKSCAHVIERIWNHLYGCYCTFLLDLSYANMAIFESSNVRVEQHSGPLSCIYFSIMVSSCTRAEKVRHFYIQKSHGIFCECSMCSEILGPWDITHVEPEQWPIPRKNLLAEPSELKRIVLLPIWRWYTILIINVFSSLKAVYRDFKTLRYLSKRLFREMPVTPKYVWNQNKEAIHLQISLACASLFNADIYGSYGNTSIILLF